MQQRRYPQYQQPYQYQQYQQPKKKVPPQAILLGSIIVIIVLITIGAIVLLWPAAPEPLDFSLQPVETSVTQGEGLALTQSLQSADVPTTIEYVIEHLTSKEIIHESSEVHPANAPIPSTHDIRIPESALPGQYVLTAFVRRNGQQTRSSFSFRIREQERVRTPIPTQPTEAEPTEPVQEQPEEPISEPSITRQPGECPVECNDYDQCTIDRCVNGQCVFDPFTPCCGNNECEAGETQTSCALDCQPRGMQMADAVSEVTQRAASQARSNPSEAVNICKSLSTQFDTDQCLLLAAQEARKFQMCLQVNNLDDRDTCLLDQAIENGAFEACEHVGNRWLQDSCNHYQRLQELE